MFRTEIPPKIRSKQETMASLIGWGLNLLNLIKLLKNENNPRSRMEAGGPRSKIE